MTLFDFAGDHLICYQKFPISPWGEITSTTTFCLDTRGFLCL